MSSQSSTQDTSELPSTPQPLGAENPLKSEIPRSKSPTTSMMAAGSSTFHSSSITPPPSSQAPKHHASSLRSITPEMSIPSSPPPTVANGKRREAVSTALT